MEYSFKASAFRQLKKLPKSVQKRIVNKLDFYISSPNPFRFAERLIDKKFGDYRFRIGEYRIFCDSEKDTIMILKIGHRKDVYKK